MSDYDGRSARFWDAFQPDARISARTFRKDAATVSPERQLVFLRPPQDDDPRFPDPDEDPPPPGDPCAGKPFVHAPLLAAQIDLGFGVSEPRPCPSQADSDRIAAAVRRQFSRVVPQADVRIDCRPPILTIAVWEPWNGDPCELQARLRALERLDLLEGNEAFGFLVRASLISFQAAQGFALAPKQYDGVGAPSPFGSIHLTGLSVEFRPPDNAVVTRISGYDDRPWPDVGFTLTVTDVIDDRRAEVKTTTRDLDKDDGDIWTAILGALFLGAGGFLLTPLLFPAALFVIAGDVEAAVRANDPSGVAGVGRRALGLVPREVPLPGKTKLLLFYGRSDVTRAGMFFGGAMLEEARQPEAAITGPAALVIGDDARDVSAEFRLAIADTFGSLTINWQSGEGLMVERPNSRETTVTFRRGNLTANDPPVTRTLRVTVADRDGFQAELTHTVDVFVAESDGLPPICLKHPELPQCRPESPGNP